MHYICEVLLPPMPAEEIHAAIEEVLAPFDENQEPDEDGYTNPNTFWDFWVIGGRWASSKLTDALDPEKKEAFFKELTDMGITVSGVTAGKQSLQPETQIPVVDAVWKKYFPEWDACPLFAHYHNQYADQGAVGDILPLKEVPNETNCATFIIAGLNVNRKLDVKHLLFDSIWNGVSWQDTAFDGKVLPAIENYKEKLSRYPLDYAARNTPTDDWLLVTVDYHS
jgi:hypothetical protein